VKNKTERGINKENKRKAKKLGNSTFEDQ